MSSGGDFVIVVDDCNGGGEAAAAGSSGEGKVFEGVRGYDGEVRVKLRG